MPPPRLLVRADADAQIGAGHVMRCLALAQAWQDRGGRATFALSDSDGPLPERLRSEGVEVAAVEGAVGGGEDARWTSGRARHADWLVLDGYRFGTEYQRAVAAAGTPFLVLDDYGHAERYACDLLLNQNIGARPETYPRTEPRTRLLLGTRFAMLRREFRESTAAPPRFPPRRVLVTLGGGDPDNVTAVAVEALEKTGRDDLDVTVLAGANNVHHDALASQVERAPFEARLLRAAADMPSLIGAADVVVSAGGSTCWELAYMGRPNLIVSIAANQSGIAEGLDAAGVSVHAGWFEDVTAASLSARLADLLRDAPRLAEMSRRGRALVDGRGAGRVVEAMLSGSDAEGRAAGRPQAGPSG